ncbi:MAG: sulfur carrier protein ThiS [Candidatus Azobacteroides sp.]|nr:sulfur carrier protein ThiS [Candidatus Azobacteroides sp.]
MKIQLNEKEYEVKEGCTLNTFMSNIGISPKGVAIAINNQVIPKEKWEATVLSDKTEIMLIHAVSGG